MRSQNELEVGKDMEMGLNGMAACRAALERREQALEKAIGQLSEAVGNHAPDRAEIAAFFHDFLDGIGDPYGEVSAHVGAEARAMDQEILGLEEQISVLVGPEKKELLGRYEELMNLRLSAEMDHAFLVGYQTAIRFLLMGLLPLKGFIRSADMPKGGTNPCQ